MERETGLEPATDSLEGYYSTTELLPLGTTRAILPEKPGCCRNFLLPNQIWRGQDSNLRSPEGRRVYSPLPLSTRPPLRRHLSTPFHKYGVLSWREESNPQPADYKSAALPLSYASVPNNSCPARLTHAPVPNQRQCQTQHGRSESPPPKTGRTEFSNLARWMGACKAFRSSHRRGRRHPCPITSEGTKSE